MVLYRLLFFLVGAGLVALVVQVFRKPVETARAVAGFLGGARARVRADPVGIRTQAIFAAIVAASIFAFGLVGVISDAAGALALMREPPRLDATAVHVSLEHARIVRILACDHDGSWVHLSIGPRPLPKDGTGRPLVIPWREIARIDRSGAITHRRDVGLADVVRMSAEGKSLLAVLADGDSTRLEVSEDGGATWRRAPAPAPERVLGVVRDARGVWLAWNPESVFSSADRGKTWSERGVAPFEFIRGEHWARPWPLRDSTGWWVPLNRMSETPEERSGPVSRLAILRDGGFSVVHEWSSEHVAGFAPQADGGALLLLQDILRNTSRVVRLSVDGTEPREVWRGADTSAELIAGAASAALDAAPPRTPRSFFSVPPTHFGVTLDAGRSWRWFDATALVPSESCIAGNTLWSYSAPKRTLSWADIHDTGEDLR